MTDLRDIIREDLENKKPFEAKFSFKCSGCGMPIVKGDTFFFVGSKKVDATCLSEMQDMV